MEICKDLNIFVGNYVLHSNLHARDMDNVDLVLGYPWIKLVGIININANKQFMKLWYKKRKINLQDIYLTKQETPNGVNEKVSTGNLEVIPIDTLDDESMVQETTDDTKAQEDMPHDGHQSEKKSPQEPQVIELNQEAPVVKVASYDHPHHLMRQQSLGQGSGYNQPSYGPQWKHTRNQHGTTWKT